MGIARTLKPEYKFCPCGKKFFRIRGKGSNKDWDNKRRYCSHPCAVRFFYPKRQKILWAKPEYREMMSKSHSNYRGGLLFIKNKKTQYSNLHHWVKRKLGKPRICEFCKNQNLPIKKYQWANKSGKYKKNIKDWIRLCVYCHLKRDYQSRKKRWKKSSKL